MAKSKIKKSTKKAYRKHRVSPFKILLIPLVIFTIYYMVNDSPRFNQISLSGKEEIPSEYIPIYKAAEKEYGVPWNLLAAHHRVETKFSTMRTLISPVGAEGPMQFMPCTFVGWAHPTCGDLGKGEIPESQKTDPEVIKKYGGYGVDGNGDGLADPFQIEDAIFSAANYLARNGAADGHIEQAVFAYNHSHDYVEDVMYFADKYVEQLNEQKGKE
ncbi:lytic transglycosylase domain-containing protein [Rossellomorea aquimaris]|uniref:lytic transglycosylase domain-containing protein n=1 Tax=Rossellomorea aquimaris TaxID=189382 RepID=UPI001CD41F61|nr:lytic transglycosylase domain-containing protein [Rossellomorea aquimaris]MCA1053823.1 lytic transglycosylase domain-containing protein [Rossellomorea aquimaris]